MPANYQAQTIHRFPLLGSQIRTACQNSTTKNPNVTLPQASFKAIPVSLFQKERYKSFFISLYGRFICLKIKL